MKAFVLILLVGCTLPFAVVGFLVSMVMGSFMAGVRLEHWLKDWAGSYD